MTVTLKLRISADFPPIATLQISTSKQSTLENLDAGMAPQSLNEIFAELMGLQIDITVTFIFLFFR